MNVSTTTRVLILCMCLLAGAGILAYDRRPAPLPPRDSLSTLPMKIGEWEGRTLPDLGDNARHMLQLTDYTNRFYARPDGTTVGLYIGYHAAGGFHSPLNCLPGAGWIPVKTGRMDLSVKASPHSTTESAIPINRVIILKGLDKQVVLYWYQGCGRAIASEYWGLIYGMIDKMRLGRADAALVRVISPVESLEPADEEAAGKRAADFARLVYPLLSRYIPN